MKRLIEIQRKLKAPKGQYNSFGKYKYRSAEDILEAVKPLLHEQELLLNLTDEVTLIGDRYYIRATATIMGENLKVQNTAYAREDADKKGMDGSQITGTASSYARKYALNGLFLIDDTKDPDTDEYHKQTHKQVEQANNFDMFAERLKQSKTLQELQAVWAAMSPQAQSVLVAIKDERKAQLSK